MIFAAVNIDTEMRWIIGYFVIGIIVTVICKCNSIVRKEHMDNETMNTVTLLWPLMVLAALMYLTKGRQHVK
jgi:Na+/proline symporter